MSFYSLKGTHEQIAASTATQALEKLRSLITYGPRSIEDWMRKTNKTHPDINTESHEAFLDSLVQHGYVLVTKDKWTA